MKLSIEQIDHIAKLSRLSLTDDEKAMYADQLSAVLGYIEILGEVNTDGVEETTQVTGLEDVVRNDVVESISPEKRNALLDAFPERSGDYLKVKAVFDSGE